MKQTAGVSSSRARVVCAITALAAVPACSWPGDEIGPEEKPTIGEVTQEATGRCGTTDVCIEHEACESWDLNRVGDGLGYTVQSWSEAGNHYSGQCIDEVCTGQRTCELNGSERREELLDTRPGISQPALNGFTVTTTRINYIQHVDGCDDGDRHCIVTWNFDCRLQINNYPTPITAVHDWCDCAEFQTLPCGTSPVVTGGNAHTCALMSGGVHCWGSNSNGQLGNNSTADTFHPVRVSGVNTGEMVSAGGFHACAITVNGAARCWGANALGQLGNGETTDRRTSVAVSGLNRRVQVIAAGANHTCAVVLGAAKCWGNNTNGQLGNNSTATHSSVPVQVGGLTANVQTVTGGGSHSCAITSGGSALCWGLNLNGQLGNGTNSDSRVPVQVTGLTSSVQAISAGFLHTCALVNGGVRCWGSNDFGQLGDGSTTSSTVPVTVSGLASGVASIAAGRYHTCARMSTGQARCWGSNGTGQLGSGTLDSSLVPVAVTGLSNVQALAAGFQHSCAVTGGKIHCWGLNLDGQLATDSTLESTVPLQVPELSCSGSPMSCRDGCSDGSVEQPFLSDIVGCAGSVTYANRASLCGYGFVPASALWWVLLGAPAAPTHNYWTNEALRRNGSASACFVSTTTGTDCGASPMRLCTPSGTDVEGNQCNWTHCGFDATTPDLFFGGCTGNTTAGTLCVRGTPPAP